MQNADQFDRPAGRSDAFQSLRVATLQLTQALQKIKSDAEMRGQIELAVEEAERWDGMS